MQFTGKGQRSERKDSNDVHTRYLSPTQTDLKGLPSMSKTKQEYTHHHFCSTLYVKISKNKWKGEGLHSHFPFSLPLSLPSVPLLSPHSSITVRRHGLLCDHQSWHCREPVEGKRKWVSRKLDPRSQRMLISSLVQAPHQAEQSLCYSLCLYPML